MYGCSSEYFIKFCVLSQNGDKSADVKLVRCLTFVRYLASEKINSSLFSTMTRRAVFELFSNVRENTGLFCFNLF